ncbi:MULTISPECIES: WbqC family protein [unclassified Streptomyces]|uniref:WbqC family protein n=1 Tax=unclassified Streptomyces TaxID=2593676 RepID=UPI002E28886F|nr:WbqC family protein [Streptomyces sp. NBC_00223]
MIHIEQPPFLPWLGFCEALLACSTLALYDDVQFTERGWQNRNRIKTANGIAWITVPVSHKNGQLIRDTRIAESFDPTATIKGIRLAYGRTTYIDEALQVLAPPLSAGHRWLADLTLDLVTQIALALGSRASLLLTSQMTLTESDDKTERLALICEAADETTLWAGSGTRQYLDTAALAERVTVIWNEFTDRHPRYAQPWQKQGFAPGLSVVDAACSIGWAGVSAMLRAGLCSYRPTADTGEAR